MLSRIKVAACLAVLVLAVGSCGSERTVAEPDPQPAVQLPSLDNLPAVGSSARHRSAFASYELMVFEPVVVSGSGSAVHNAGELTLDPSLNNGLAWAIYALPGFPTDYSVSPLGLSVDSNATPLWAGYSNYLYSHWKFISITNPANNFLPEGVIQVSSAGMFYIVIVTDVAATVSQVTVMTTGDLPGGPAAQLDLVGQAAAGLPAAFTVEGSNGGDGTITELTYTFDGGSPYTTSDPLEQVEFTFATTGPHTVALTVANDMFRTAQTELNVNVVEPFRELLVVYNSDIAESQDLAEYYTSAATGRAIDPQYMLGLAMGTNDTDIIRTDFNTRIRDPLKAHLDASAYKSTIKYIVLFKGVPYRITDNGNGAVDSELCMLYEDGNYDYNEKLWSGDIYALLVSHFDNSQFYEALDGADKDFTPFAYTACDSNNIPYTVSYLVGRISAYTYDDAKLSIDRSLNADTSGTGWVIMDTHEGWRDTDTMSDPVWPWPTADAQKCLQELLDEAGYSNFLDMEYSVLLSEGMPEGAAENVIGFTGWGVNHAREGGGNYPSTKMYILQDLNDLVYRPGAAWIVYESFAAQNFTWDGTEAGHIGQGQICDFIRMGGTVAAGNCYEPFTSGVPDERRVMERYLIEGDRWIEACYKGIRYFSWHTIVLGDPLCQVVAE